MSRCPATDTWCCGDSVSCCGTDKAISLAPVMPMTSIFPTSTQSTKAVSTTTQLPPTELSSSESSNVSGAAVAGISVSVFVAGLLLGCSSATFVARRRQQQQQQDLQPKTIPSHVGELAVPWESIEKGDESQSPSVYGSGRMVRMPSARELDNERRLPVEMGSYH